MCSHMALMSSQLQLYYFLTSCLYIYIVSHPLHEPNLQQIPAIKVLPKPNEVEQCELQIGVDRRLTDSSLWHQTWDVFVCLNSWGVVGFK